MENKLSLNMQARFSEDLTKAILNVVALLGCSDFTKPDRLEIQRMVDYMTKHMPGVRPVDIVEAFEHLIKGVLDINPENVKKITVLGIQNILQSYNRYKLAKMPRLRLAERNEISSDEKERIMKNAALDIFERTQKQKVFSHEFHWSLFNYLNSHQVIIFSEDNSQVLGKIPDGTYQKIEDTEDIIDQARTSLKEPRVGDKTTVIGDMITRTIETGIPEIMVKNKARGIAVREYYYFLILNEYQLKDILK